MDQLIVYGTQYGTTQRYAERFSQLTRLPCISSEAVKDLSPYGRVIHFGGLYAGGVKVCVKCCSQKECKGFLKNEKLSGRSQHG